MQVLDLLDGNKDQNKNADTLNRIVVSSTSITSQSTNEYQKCFEEISQHVIINNNVIENAGNLFETTDEYALEVLSGHFVFQDFYKYKVCDQL